MLRFTQGLAKKTGPLKQIFWSQTTTWNFRTPIPFLKDWIHLLTYFWCVAFLASLILFANRFVEWRKDIGVGPFIPPDLVMWTQETWRTENQFISHRVSVKDKLTVGKNTLLLDFASAFIKVFGLPLSVTASFHTSLGPWTGEKTRNFSALERWL